MPLSLVCGRRGVSAHRTWLVVARPGERSRAMWLRSQATVITMKVNTTRRKDDQMATNSATAARKGTKKSSNERRQGRLDRTRPRKAPPVAFGLTPLRRLAASPRLRRVLRTVERREKTLRSALKRHKKTLKQLKKSTTPTAAPSKTSRAI